MNDNIRSKVTEQIRKLLNLNANNGATEGEVAAAMSAAERLMLKYQIDRAEAEASSPTTPAYRCAAGRIHVTTWRIMQWETYLGSAIIELTGTVRWIKHEIVEREVGTFKTSKRALALEFFGPADDVELAVSMWEEWHHVIATLAMGKYGSLYAGKGAAYAMGFAMKLYERARQMASERKQITAQSSSTGAIVLVQNTIERGRAAGEEFGKSRYGKVRKARRGKKYVMNEFGGEAWQQGQSDGGRAEFEAKRLKRLSGGVA